MPSSHFQMYNLISELKKKSFKDSILCFLKGQVLTSSQSCFWSFMLYTSTIIGEKGTLCMYKKVLLFFTFP